MSLNNVPSVDGQIATYHTEHGRGEFYDSNRRVIFINGMDNTPQDHRDAAVALSLMQMCPVVGVYNATGGFWRDLGQCIADKWQFNAPLPGDVTSAFEAYCENLKQKNDTRSRRQIARDLLARNPSAASMFDLLLDPSYSAAPVFAHSQGNLILSNALQAAALAEGPGAIAGREVHSFGSPCRSWPKGIIRYEYAFTFDMVTFLSLTMSLSVSKIGVPTGQRLPFAHSFMTYMENSPEFFVNRRRWGAFGFTVSMDEDGLAEDLVALGTNAPRIYKIFRWLYERHNSDVDDVALAYVQKLRKSHAGGSTILTLKRHPDLFPLLIKSMAEGWTTAAEKEAIAFLKSV
ncbi:MAG: hypothetical protein KF866_06635 [Phycisphaeraceae bacterium]|nr:hypothetical protein [Phycisphaeraceae bacterium]